MKSIEQKPLKKALEEILSRGPELDPRERSIINSMEIAPRDGIVRIFYYDFLEERSMHLQEAEANEFYVRTLPYAWVLKAGKDFKLGDVQIEETGIVRLYDWNARTMVNPKHKAYYENSASNSNAERIGVAPSQFIHRIFKYADRVTFLTPEKEPELKDFFTFLLPAPEFSGYFSDPKSLLI